MDDPIKQIRDSEAQIREGARKTIEAWGEPAREERAHREKVIALLTRIANYLENIDGALKEIKENRK